MEKRNKNKSREILFIDKEFLKYCKTLSLGLENCENFTIDAADIIDLVCEARQITNDGRSCNAYRTDKGYIKISKRAKDILSDFAYRNDGDQRIKPFDGYNEDDCKLVNRLTLCADICVFDLVDKADKTIQIYVPYDPVEEVVHRSEIDYSNCPSFEIDENGDMEIRFGDMSRLPILKRNNYIDLVDGWEAVFGDYRPKKIKMSIDLFKTDLEQNKTCDIEIIGDILNKKAKHKTVSFGFINCERLMIEYWGHVCKSEVFMSKMLDGRIYAGIGDTLSVICKSCCVDDAQLD